jgi:hypothetical protein
MTVTMSRQEYDALLNAALTGNATDVPALQEAIDAANSITRYRLFLRWQDVGGSVPSRIELGAGWPPEQTFLLELSRPIAREDVLQAVNAQARNPAEIYVTPDPTGVVGFTQLDSYDFVTNAPIR